MYHSQTHNGINETYNHFQKLAYTPNIKKIITNYINECQICLLSKYERHPYKTPFKGPLIASKTLEHIFLDTFSIENENFLTIIDLFSKYAQAYCIPSRTTISILNKLRHFMSHHNFPDKVTADSAGEFNNGTIKEYFKLHNVEYHITSSMNPTSLSPLERFHSTLK